MYKKTKLATLLKPKQIKCKRKSLLKQISELKKKISRLEDKMFNDVQSRCPHPTCMISLENCNGISFEVCKLCGMAFE
jgi:hypothetical protein